MALNVKERFSLLSPQWFPDKELRGSCSSHVGCVVSLGVESEELDEGHAKNLSNPLD